MFRKERLQLKKRKNAALKVLLLSAFITFICFSMLVGTTYAWLTDSVTSGRNKIISGSLSVQLNYLGDGNLGWVPATDDVFGDVTWEPDRLYYRAIEIKNNGDIPVKYSFKANVIDEHGSINTQGEPFYISGSIKSQQVTSYTSRDNFTGDWGNGVHTYIDNVAINGFGGFTELTGDIAANSAKYVLLILQMPGSGVEASTKKDGMPDPTFSIEVDVAVAQAGSSSDSFGNDVASNATVASVSRATKYYELDKVTGLYKTVENNVNTYYVSSKEDFNKFVNKVNTDSATFAGSTIKLTEDIDLEGAAWAPIAANFAGTFDGGYTYGTSTRSHVISNFKVSADYGATEVTLFNSGTVTNLSVNTVEVTKAADPNDNTAQPTVTNITEAVSVTNGKIAV